MDKFDIYVATYSIRHTLCSADSTAVVDKQYYLRLKMHKHCHDVYSILLTMHPQLYCSIKPT